MSIFKSIKIIGSGQASDTLSLHHRKHLNQMPAIRMAAKRAFKSCGKKVGDLDLIEQIYQLRTNIKFLIGSMLNKFTLELLLII